MPCKGRYGVQNICPDLLFPGGVDPGFWVGYVSDLSVKPSLNPLAVVSSLSFYAYAGLVYYSGSKFSHSGSWPSPKGPGGNTWYEHTFIAKLISLSVQDDNELQALQQATDAFVISKNNNGSFLIYGIGNGLVSDPGTGGTGTAAADDVTDTITLKGAEKTRPLRFLVTDEAATIAYLNARVI